MAFSPSESFSRPSVEPTSSPESSRHALEAVTDGVAMGEQPLGGSRHVAVRLQEGLDGLHELGLVLLVVGHQRLDRLGVEALQLGRVLAHGGEQQPVGARLLEGEHRPLGVALGDVGRQQRLGAGTVQVDRVRRGTAAPEREGVAGKRACSSRRTASARARGARVVGAGEQDHDLRAHARRRGRRGRPRRAGSTARAPRSATAEDPQAPAVLGRDVRMRAGDDHARAPTRSIPSSPARPRIVLAAGESPVEQRVHEAGQRVLGGALGRAQRARPRRRSAW